MSVSGVNSCILHQSSARKKGSNLSVFYVVLRQYNNLDMRGFCDLSVGPWNDQSPKMFGFSMHAVERSVDGLYQKNFIKLDYA